MKKSVMGENEENGGFDGLDFRENDDLSLFVRRSKF